MIAIGVPTVVDVQTFANDLTDGKMYTEQKNRIEPSGKQMIITPREIDLLTERASRLIGFALNAAIQNEFELADLISLM